MEKLLLIDGNSILNRAYYGIRPLTAPDGTPTNAVYGFLNILFKYLEEEKPDYLCVAFDVKAKTFRHKMYDQYKAQRKPAPEDFLVQIPLIKEALGAMRCACIEMEGYEADDLIGTVSLLCDEKKIACRILTGDKDDLQLASDNTVIRLVVTRMGKTTTTDYDAIQVKEKYGVTPKEFIDVKGLMGDPSDNIPGVKGIGEKTALSLIQNYHTIEEIYARLDELELTPSVRKKLAEDRDGAYLSKTLATIDRAVPIDIDLAAFRMRDYDAPALGALFTRLNFQSFLQKLSLPAVGDADKPSAIRGVKTVIDESEMARCLKKETVVSYTLRRDGNTAALFFTQDGETVYTVFDITKSGLTAFFQDVELLKCGFCCKEDILYLMKQGIDYQGLCFDVMIAAYLAEPTKASYTVEDLCLTYLGAALSDTEKQTEADGQLTMDFSDSIDDGQHEVDRTAAIFALQQYFKERIEQEGQHRLYYEVELPLSRVLADMQYVGVYVDKDALQAFGAQLRGQIDALTAEIYDLAGEEFNINSPKQLGDILFAKLHLPGGKKNKNGYSTNVEVLNRLLDQHPIVEKVLKFRQLTKLQSTYVEGLIPMIDQKTGRIHSNFNQTVTATGRISSTEPNLQNIPVRTQLGREIRRMFVAENEDSCLVDADYSQIELRVLAHISDDDTMKGAFLHELDIHTQTASQVFGVPMDAVTPTMRSRAKAVNFGIVYGIGAFSLAQDLKIPMREADAYIKGYLQHYPKVDAYMKDSVAFAREKGYAVTLLGRRRYMPELRASNKVTQAFGERVAMNAPIQGTAADIIKIAMVAVHRRLKEEKLRARLILQIHDELIVETPQEEADAVQRILREEMERAYPLHVPLVVDMNTGKSWYDTK